jgi:hypothetical protein
MTVYNLDQTLDALDGLPREQIKVHNYWAATAFDRYHQNSRAEIKFIIHGEITEGWLTWDSEFSKIAMRETKDIANNGGVAMAWFVMAVLLGYKYVEQSEIGDGVDYRFWKEDPDDDFNFLKDNHFVEVSGILEESKTNTLVGRVKQKHNQITRGSKHNETSSVIVTLFKEPITIKEIHNEA